MKYFYASVFALIFILSGSSLALAEDTHFEITTTSIEVEKTDSSTDSAETGVACTTEYAPVCGEVKVQCVTAPCDPVQETFSNTCNLKVRGATFLYEGECKNVEKDEIGDDETEEANESDEKGGTEDINIGIGELSGEATDDEHKEWIIIESADGTEVRMNKADLIESIIGDDSDDDGASRTSKPKEIVVVGSKVRESAIPQIGDEVLVGGAHGERVTDSFFDIWVEAVSPERGRAFDSFFDIDVDVTDEDVELQAISVAQSDDGVEEVEVDDEEVRVSYRERFELFGFIPVSGKRTIVVSIDGAAEDRVKVKFPWWRVLSRVDTDGERLRGEIENALNDAIPPKSDADDRPTEEVAFYYNKIKAQALKTISDISLSFTN